MATLMTSAPAVRMVDHVITVFFASFIGGFSSLTPSNGSRILQVPYHYRII